MYSISPPALDNITLDHLSMTGGFAGVYADYGSSLDRQHDLQRADLRQWLLRRFPGQHQQRLDHHLQFHPRQCDGGPGRGVDIDGPQVTITNNTVFNRVLRPAREHVAGALVSGNETYAATFGIQADAATISNNRVHDNTTAGIFAGGDALVIGNTRLPPDGGQRLRDSAANR